MDFNKNKIIKIVCGIGVILFLASEYQNISYKLGNYPCTKPYEELTFSEKIVSALGSYKFQTKSEQIKEEVKARDNQCNFSDSQISTMPKNPEKYRDKILKVKTQIFYDDCKQYSVNKYDIYHTPMPHSDLGKLQLKVSKDSKVGKVLTEYGLNGGNIIRTSDILNIEGKIMDIDNIGNITFEDDSIKLEIIKGK